MVTKKSKKAEVEVEPSLDEDKVEQETPEERDDAPEAEEAEDSMADLEAPAATPTSGVVPLILTNKARAMKEQLSKEPKVRVFIPLASGEKQGVTQSFNFNGYPVYVRKGQYVNVPQSVADALDTKMKQKTTVEDHPERISADRPVKLTSYGN